MYHFSELPVLLLNWRRCFFVFFSDVIFRLNRKCNVYAAIFYSVFRHLVTFCSSFLGMDKPSPKSVKSLQYLDAVNMRQLLFWCYTLSWTEMTLSNLRNCILKLSVANNRADNPQITFLNYPVQVYQFLFLKKSLLNCSGNK